MKSLVLTLLALTAWQTPAAADTARAVQSLDDCNLAWDSPSRNSFGSMPLGNGDIGVNLWVEESGDLVFYVSKVDAYDANHSLYKLGRVRLRLAPALATEKFRQTLVLRNGAILIQGGDVGLRIWVDANHPAIRVEGSSATPREARIALETLRPLTHVAGPAAAKLPAGGTAGFLLDDNTDRLAWCYRNLSSAWADRLRSQNTPEMAAKADDPILHRTSGCLLQGPGLSGCRRLGLEIDTV